MDPVPGMPILEPNQPGPSAKFMLRKNTINPAKITVKILIPSNYTQSMQKVDMHQGQ
jgi:hypothetical protein